MALIFGPLLAVNELEQEDQRNEERLFRRELRDAQDPFRIPEAEFRHFRFHKDAAREVINIIEPFMMNSRYSSRIPKLLRILCALNFFASGSYQRSVGSNVLACCSQPVVSRSVKEVSNIIVRHLLKLWVHFPENERERHELEEGFQRQHQMPLVIGIIDGTHVSLRKPTNNEHVYVNRKGYHSINCQIICDSNQRIINVVARWPGSSHDSFVWRSSRIGQAMRANYENGDVHSCIMGDSGYPCLPWLLVPMPNPQTAQELRYNRGFKTCRSGVERCIGLMKGRFRCLLKDRTLHYSPQIAAKIIITCCVLHNMAIYFRVEDPELRWDNIDLDQQLPLPQAPHRPELEYRRLG